MMSKPMLYAMTRAASDAGQPLALAKLKGSHLPHHLSRARFYAWAYLRAVDPEKYSMPVLARLFAIKDHTSVLYGVRRMYAKHGEAHFWELADADGLVCKLEGAA
ncbi:hypothetical protein [Henriciella sp.]|uniref:hypothetical protein n=1 Tax=Henriciella sp. TaxID=1968823 RepID=UPI002627321B|nr:hypothetical protein [Henriciella sp.]